jgi:hypothetical protein
MGMIGKRPSPTPNGLKRYRERLKKKKLAAQKRAPSHRRMPVA